MQCLPRITAAFLASDSYYDALEVQVKKKMDAVSWQVRTLGKINRHFFLQHGG